MKTTKIVMGMAAAAVMALTSCVFPGKGLGNVPITTDEKTNTTTKAEVTGTVDFTNTDSSEYARGMQTFQNNKKGITAKVVMKNVTAASNPGAMGLVFDMQKKDGLLDFGTVGFKNENGKVCYYVAYYEGVSEADFSKQNFGVEDSARTDIVDWGTSAHRNSESIISSIGINGNKELACVIEIEAQSPTGTLTDESPAYIIRVYADEDGDGTVSKFKGLSNKSASEKEAIHALAKESVTITRGQVKAGKTGRTVQNKMGFYANVYGGQTLTGEWLVADIDHDPNVAKTAATEDSFIKIEY